MGISGRKVSGEALKPNQMGYTPSTLPVEGYEGDYPPLEGTHAEATHDWYRVWATSPQAAVFMSTDWQRLQMVAFIVDELHEPTYTDRGNRTVTVASALAEIRQNEGRLGATVGDRMSLYMKTATPLGNQPPAADVTDGDENLPDLQPFEGREMTLRIVAEG